MIGSYCKARRYFHQKQNSQLDVSMGYSKVVYTVLSRMTLPESPEQHVGTHEMIAMGTETPAKKNVMGYVIVG